MPSLITIAGIGAVSSAGWGVEALRLAIQGGVPLKAEKLVHPSGALVLERPVRRVPKPDPRPAFLTHPRLRRASPISHFAAAAALEAVGPDRLPAIREGKVRTGIVCSLLNGSVNYSARFHSEVLTDPGTASPLLFPETVFNAPASHVAALLGITSQITTVLGDTAQFFPAIEIAIQWLLDDLVDTCLVIGAEEADWLTAEALALLAPGAVLSEGAGALYLEKKGSGPVISAIYGPAPITTTRQAAAAELLKEIGLNEETGTVIITDVCGDQATDSPTRNATSAWPDAQVHPRVILGESLGAAAAIQSVLAAQSVISGDYPSSLAIATGGNMQAAALEIRKI